MAFPDPIIIGPNSYVRLADGLYRLSTSTSDQPIDLILKNTLNPDGISTFLIERRTSKNSTVPGQRDDVLRVMTQVKMASRAFTAGDVRTSLNELDSFLDTSGYVDRIILGER